MTEQELEALTKYIEYVKYIDNMTNAISLNSKINVNVDENDSSEVGELIGTDDTTFNEIIKKDNLEFLLKLVKKLSPSESYVIINRYGLLNGVPKTLEAIGDSLHLTRERIRQLEYKGLHKLRKIIKENKLSIEDFNI